MLLQTQQPSASLLLTSQVTRGQESPGAHRQSVLGGVGWNGAHFSRAGGPIAPKLLVGCRPRALVNTGARQPCFPRTASPALQTAGGPQSPHNRSHEPSLPSCPPERRPTGNHPQLGSQSRTPGWLEFRGQWSRVGPGHHSAHTCSLVPGLEAPWRSHLTGRSGSGLFLVVRISCHQDSNV